jgi:cytochrome c-type biogenesis protein CcmH
LKALLLAVLLAAGPALALEPDEILSDPALEARAVTLSKELRCLVCQNESIHDSSAPLARDLRVIVRERLQAGDGDRAILDYVVARYGDFVLLRPPVRPETWVLWFGPPAVLLLAGAVILAGRRRQRASGPAPLTAAERQRLDALLAEPRE